MDKVASDYQKGAVVEVIQQIPHGKDHYTTQVRGSVVKFEQKKTGSWFAHAKDDRLWLDRLTLRKDDGEIIVVNLDKYTHVTVVDGSGLCEST